MLVDNEDWTKVSLSVLAHAAQGGAHGAADELRRREIKGATTDRMSPSAKAAMASRARNGRPGK